MTGLFPQRGEVPPPSPSLPARWRLTLRQLTLRQPLHRTQAARCTLGTGPPRMLLRGSPKGSAWIGHFLKGSFKKASRKLRESFKKASRKLRESFKKASRAKKASRKLRESFEKASRKLQESFKKASKTFQGNDQKTVKLGADAMLTPWATP